MGRGKRSRHSMNSPTKLAQGLGVAGVKRFPYIGELFNAIRLKKTKFARLQEQYQALLPVAQIVAAHGKPLSTKPADQPLRLDLHTVAKHLAAAANIKATARTFRGKVPGPTALAVREAETRVLKVLSAEDNMFAKTIGVRTEKGKGKSTQNIIQQQTDAPNQIERVFTTRLAELQPRYLDPLEQAGSAATMLGGSDKLAAMGAEISELSEQWQPSDSNVQEVEKLTKLIQSTAIRWNPQCKTFTSLIGSRSYGLCTDSSDLDVLLTVKVPGEDAEVKHVEFFHNLARGLYSHQGFTKVIKIMHTRVPIIKFEYLTRGNVRLEGDISINGSMSVAKTNLISSYMQIDSRVREVLLVLKVWGIRRGIINQNVLNSFGLMMMGIAFLISRRVVPPLQLISTAKVGSQMWTNLDALHADPEAIARMYQTELLDEQSRNTDGICCLHSGKVLPDWSVEGIRGYFMNNSSSNSWESPNDSSAAELIHELFHFYGNEFDPINCAISPRLGTASIPRTSLSELQVPSCTMHLTSPENWNRSLRLLAIEDPFELEINCGRNAPPEWVEGFLWEMRRAAWALGPRRKGSRHSAIKRLLVEPSANIFKSADVWAPAYRILLPVLQSVLEDEVFVRAVDLTENSLIDIEAFEEALLDKTHTSVLAAVPAKKVPIIAPAKAPTTTVSVDSLPVSTNVQTFAQKIMQSPHMICLTGELEAALAISKEKKKIRDRARRRRVSAAMKKRTADADAVATAPKE